MQQCCCVNWSNIMSFATAIIVIAIIWMFKGLLNQLLSSWVSTASKYSEAAEHHAQRIATFTKVDAGYAQQEAEIRAKARIKALKQSNQDLPDL